MSVFLASLVVVGFAVTVERLGLAGKAREVGTRARDCAEVLGDPGLDDREKERRLQSQAVRLLGLLGRLAGGSALALGVPLLGVWLLERAGLASLAEVLAVLERPDFLAAATAAGVAGWLLLRRAGRA